MAATPTTTPEETPELDRGKTFAFMTKLLTDLSGGVASIMGSIGDRLGLFKDLAANGSATPDELASRTGIQPRYAREWLSAMAAAGYVEYDRDTQRFTLPPEHAVAVAGEGGPMFLGGAFQQLPALFGRFDDVTRVFRDGGGIPSDAYGPEIWQGVERLSATWFENMLAQEWIPTAPALRQKLEEGASVADVGCGPGRAVIALAKAFPASTFVGFDVSETALDAARENAAAAAVADRVAFELVDAVEGLPGSYDMITMFDLLHDIPEPATVLANIREALKPGGSFLLLDINASEKLEENVGPVATMLYGTSVLFCLPTSLETGAPGLGTMGLPHAKVVELCAAAGLSSVERLPVFNPFNSLYEIKP